MSARNAAAAVLVLAAMAGVVLYFNKAERKVFKPNTTVPTNDSIDTADLSDTNHESVSRRSFNNVWKRRHDEGFVEVVGGKGLLTDIESIGLKDGEIGYHIDEHGRRFLHVRRANDVLVYHDRYSAGADDQVLYVEPRHPIDGLNDLTAARELLNGLAAETA